MSYQIQYPVTSQFERKYRVRKRSPNISLVAVICVILFIISVYIVGSEAISEYLIPGNNAVTKAAFQQMQDNLKNGMSAKDAITAFCTEIIDSATMQ